MNRATKHLKIIIHIFILILGSYFINHNSVRPVKIKKLGRFLPDLRYLLMWTAIPGLEHEGQKHFLDMKCPHVNCFLTENRTFLQDTRYFDGIIFNLQEVSDQYHEIPKVRGLTQKYIFAANDSADNYPICNSIYDSFFNWTWTYRLDSTIQYRFFSFPNLHDQHVPESHIYWLPKMKPVDANFKRLLYSKSKAAAIFLDKCQTRSRRERFLKNLQEHLAKYNLTVDVFGKCGPLKCGKRSMNSCFYLIKKIYYFYLALEDSISTEFVTSIVLFAYQNNAVPVVYGAGPYRRYLPPNSYLNGLELGEEALANKMNEIIQNKQRYYDYFRWKNHYIVRKSKILDPCTLCLTFNDPTWLFHRTSVKKFREWWNPEYEQRCGYHRRFLFL